MRVLWAPGSSLPGSELQIAAPQWHVEDDFLAERLGMALTVRLSSDHTERAGHDALDPLSLSRRLHPVSVTMGAENGDCKNNKVRGSGRDRCPDHLEGVGSRTVSVIPSRSARKDWPTLAGFFSNQAGSGRYGGDTRAPTTFSFVTRARLYYRSGDSVRSYSYALSHAVAYVSVHVRACTATLCHTRLPTFRCPVVVY